MHSIVRRYIKTAIMFLGVGLAIGGWMIVRRELFGVGPAPHMMSAHTHALFVGFVMMMILGVALWLFPRPPAGDTRYSPWLAQGAYWMLTVATALRIAGELSRTASSHGALRWAVVITGLGQISAIGIFFFNLWPRIRPAGSHIREAKGERF
jgi:cytochrome bd-type quinol oxidase subunit 2